MEAPRKPAFKANPMQALMEAKKKKEAEEAAKRAHDEGEGPRRPAAAGGVMSAASCCLSFLCPAPSPRGEAGHVGRASEGRQEAGSTGGARGRGAGRGGEPRGKEVGPASPPPGQECVMPPCAPSLPTPRLLFLCVV